MYTAEKSLNFGLVWVREDTLIKLWLSEERQCSVYICVTLQFYLSLHKASQFKKKKSEKLNVRNNAS